MTCQALYQRGLFADKDFLLEMISAAQLFPISVWNFPEDKVKDEEVDTGSNKNYEHFIYD